MNKKLAINLGSNKWATGHAADLNVCWWKSLRLFIMSPIHADGDGGHGTLFGYFIKAFHCFQLKYNNHWNFQNNGAEKIPSQKFKFGIFVSLRTNCFQFFFSDDDKKCERFYVYVLFVNITSSSSVLLPKMAVIVGAQVYRLTIVNVENEM